MENNIRKYRESVNLSATSLSKKIGITSSALLHYEKGRRNPDVKTCWKIISELKIAGCNEIDFPSVFPPEKTTKVA